ncbi:MAG: DUF3662 domain-containing protein [Eggerthellaceae bacterium]|nr:DUF3662 domain-containing protein [Eggerthellaceae bacterium]
MGIFSKFENKVEDTFEGAAGRMPGSSISPVQIAKKAEKQMRREKMVGAGKQYAPTLYTVLVSYEDDDRLFGYYPTLAGETETYLAAKAAEQGLVMDGQPLVRFIPDESLKRGKFDVVAEAVAAPIVAQLRQEEMERYGLDGSYGAASPYGIGGPHDMEAPYPSNASYGAAPHPANAGYDYDDYDDRYDYESPAPNWGEPRKPPLPYVPEDEIDYSIDYGEYTFDSRNFEDYRDAESPSSVVPNEPAAPLEPSVPNTMVFAKPNERPRQQPISPRPNMPAMALVDTATNRTHRLRGSLVRIGRETTNDVVISDINASREHAELTLDALGIWSIYDLNSTNGTFVNGREMSSCRLREGDRITIGTTTLLLTRA